MSEMTIANDAGRYNKRKHLLVFGALYAVIQLVGRKFFRCGMLRPACFFQANGENKRKNANDAVKQCE